MNNHNLYIDMFTFGRDAKFGNLQWKTSHSIRQERVDIIKKTGGQMRADNEIRSRGTEKQADYPVFDEKDWAGTAGFGISIVSRPIRAQEEDQTLACRLRHQSE